MKVEQPSNESKYDVGVFGLGYEKRSIFALQSSEFEITKKIAIGYLSNTNVHSYSSNKTFFEKNTFEITELGVTGFSDAIKDVLTGRELLEARSVVVDITAMSRGRLAEVVWFVLSNLSVGCKLDIIYTPSEYVIPPLSTTPIKKIEEIIRPLSGAIGDINLPSSLVMGLGYELNKALGVCTYLEPDDYFLLIPVSNEEGFESAVYKNNISIIESASKSSVFKYNVLDTYGSYRDIKELMISLLKTTRPIFLPLGPKILAAIGVLLGFELRPDLPVWRASSEHTEDPKERLSGGEIVTLSIRM